MTMVFATVVCRSDAAPPAAEVEFFESKIRPIFVEHCAACHGEKKQSSGLRLDTVEGIKKGADDGPVIVAGKPGESRLIKSVKRDGDYAMPPKQALDATAVARLTEWVERGAHLPEVKTTTKAIDAKNHWAFRPVVKPTPPVISVDSVILHPVDRFIERKLEANGLTLNPLPDRRTLLRRMSFDLVGLPPTIEEIRAFETDQRPNAVELQIDRLLASPHFGERWGRHWLDVARYADSKGYVFTEDRNYPYAYTYRDYVIRSFNEDKPLSQFVIEQLAADRLELKGDKSPLAALGFLTLGRRFLNNTHDIIDDRIDVVTRGLMGLTVACARCHDHKYDPIPAADYYSLYGVFASSHEPKELPLIEEQTPEHKAFEIEAARKEKAAQDYADAMYAKYLGEYRTAESAATYLLNAERLKNAKPIDFDKAVVEQKLRASVLERWRGYLKTPKRDNDPVMRAWVIMANARPDDWESTLKKEIIDSAANHPAILAAIRTAMPKDLPSLAKVYGETLARAKSDDKPLWNVLNGPEGPPSLPIPAEADKVVPIDVKRGYRKLRNEAQAFRANSPQAPARAMALLDNASPTQPVVFLRGNPSNRGPQVPLRFPAVASSGERRNFSQGSGRLELAKSIVDPANPLTDRVYVNRVWGHLFGEGLVRTPSDFGVRSDPPSHPELLDWLASTFRESGGKTKALIKSIVTSRTYQQSSRPSAAAMTKDPSNLLLSHQAIKRHDYETLRDSILMATDSLDRKIGGRSVDIFAADASTRRTLYASIDRQNLPSTLRTFDFASPDQHVPQRFQTTVPQQALYLLNDRFVVDQARRLAAKSKQTSVDETVDLLFLKTLGRSPNEEERRMTVEYLTMKPGWGFLRPTSWLTPTERLAQALLLTNEFTFAE
jgi:hypothetical protein